jgi:hypothetical protein
MLQLAGEGKFSFLDGAIITPGCDSMRRLDECWRKAGSDIEGAVPHFFFTLEFLISILTIQSNGLPKKLTASLPQLKNILK